MKKKVGKTLLITAVVFIVITLSASIFMIFYSLKPIHRGLNIESSYSDLYERYPYLENWVDSLEEKEALKDTFLINREGLRLNGYYINAPKPTENTALIIHGYTDNAVRMLMIGYLYNKDLEYNVILPDLQNHGESEGSTIQMGWKDRLDAKEWINLAINKYGDSTKLVVHGISMGAATTMMLSGEEQPKQVKCFIGDCGYTSVWDEFSQELKVRFGLPPFPIMHTTSWLCNLIYGWNFKEASSLEAVKRAKHPMFFIHGDKDTFVPTWMVYPLYEAKSEPKELWIVPEVEHAEAYLKEKEEYTKRVDQFLKENLN